jgi:hypothetical protein
MSNQARKNISTVNNHFTSVIMQFTATRAHGSFVCSEDLCKFFFFTIGTLYSVSFGKTVVLRSLSPVERTKHALELEKRSANLLVEEGNTCAQILVCLNLF